MRMAERTLCPHCGKDINYTSSLAHLPAGYVVDGKHPYVLGAELARQQEKALMHALEVQPKDRPQSVQALPDVLWENIAKQLRFSRNWETIETAAHSQTADAEPLVIR